MTRPKIKPQASVLPSILKSLFQIKGAQLAGLAAIIAAATPIYLQQRSNHEETKTQIHKTDSTAMKGRAVLLKSVNELEKDIDSLRNEIKSRHIR